MFTMCDLKPVGYSPWKPSPLCAKTTNAYFVTRLHDARTSLTSCSSGTTTATAVARAYVDLLVVLVRAWSMDRSSIRGVLDTTREPVLEFCWTEDGTVIKTSCVRAELVIATQYLTQLLLTGEETCAKDWQLAVRLQMWVVRPQLDACAGLYMPKNAASCGYMVHKTLMAMGVLRLQIAVIHQWEPKGLAGDTVPRLLCWATGTAKRLARMKPAMKDTATELEALLWLHTATMTVKTAKAETTTTTVETTIKTADRPRLSADQREALLAHARDAFLTLRQAERVAQCERRMDEIAPRSDMSPARIVQSCVAPKCVVADHAPLGQMYMPPDDLVRLWQSV